MRKYGRKVRGWYRSRFGKRLRSRTRRLSRRKVFRIPRGGYSL